MKKIIIFTVIILMIPFIIISVMLKENDKTLIKFKLNKKKIIVRIKQEDNLIVKKDLENYVIGVVSGEMPVNFELEALKAQAVASRSYVLKKIEQNKNKDYDVSDTIMDQVFLTNKQLKNKWKENYEENLKKVKKAVKETKGEYLTYNNEIIEAFFFSTSSGKTENVEDVFSEQLPYLRSVDSKWDNISPIFNSTNTYSLNEFCYNLDLNCSSKLEIKVISKNNTGSVREIKINNQIFKGTEFRKKLKLKSTFFTIQMQNNKIVISTKGYGHGVGMSQYGAEGMALDGYNYKDILKHYYKEIKISKL